MTKKNKLLGLTFMELKEAVCHYDIPPYTAKQMADWLYKKKIKSIAEMTNLSLTNREKLAKDYEVGAYPPVEKQVSADGTIKYLFETESGGYVEAVYIPSDDRATLCVSSQIGCKMKCRFCMTGRQGFSGNLTVHEIINQIQSIPEADKLTNLVFMGMGEPMDNPDEVMKALDILTSPYGYGWSPKRITVSTIGIKKGLERFLKESGCHLAVSLHSPYPDERLSLMPAEKAFPATAMLDMIRNYDFGGQRRVSFEYIVFRNLNDTEQHAKALKELLKGIPCRVNLIRFHAIPDAPYETTDINRMERFRDIVNSSHITCTIRTSRGEDIFAACGMLSTAKQRNS